MYKVLRGTIDTRT